MSRSDARIARRAAKAIKDAAGTARLQTDPTTSAVRSEYARSERTVRQAFDRGSIFAMAFTYNMDMADTEGNWSWGTPRAWSDQAKNSMIAPTLEKFAGMKWAEIEQASAGNGRRMHHSHEIATLVPEAKDRIDEKIPGTETMYRLRLGGASRLWGVRTVAEFSVVWWDPKHEIYPTEKN